MLNMRKDWEDSLFFEDIGTGWCSLRYTRNFYFFPYLDFEKRGKKEVCPVLDQFLCHVAKTGETM